jgi:predicted RNA binding protein YcfA (HicA-like mRNA interferase family)
VPKLAGVNHLNAVRALEKIGFRVARQGKHIIMTDGSRVLTIPRHISSECDYHGQHRARCRSYQRRIPQAAVKWRQHSEPITTQRHTSMTKLLRQAFEKASQLPPEQQDAVGAWLLWELESERRWNELFDRSPELLEKLAAEAIAEHDAGLTEPLDPDAL